MGLVNGPILLTAQEFAAQPLGVDTSKLLKSVTTLTTIATSGVTTSLQIASQQGSAPARFDPKASAIASYAVTAGDLVFLGDGSAADPMEWVVATGPLTGAGPYTLPINSAVINTHNVGSPVTIGSLQQELLSAALAVERHCRQPIAVVTHPDLRWPPNELRLDSIWAAIDPRGIPIIFPPFIPVVTTYPSTQLQYKYTMGSASAWTVADLTTWEVLTDRIVGPSGLFIRGQFVLFRLTYQSGYASIPDDVKEAVRITAGKFLKERGGQAVVSSSGRLATTKPAADEDLPPMAAKLLQAFKAIR